MIKIFKILLFILLLPSLARSQDYTQVTWLGYTHDNKTQIHDIDNAGNAYVTMEHYRPE